MKHFLYQFVVFAILTAISIFATAQPLTGLKSIPGDYATVGAAITALNTSGVGAGGVTFNVAAGHTETITAGGYSITTTTSSAANPVVFQKSGVGVNPVLRSAVAGSGVASATNIGDHGDGFIKILSSDNITFDGIDIVEQYAGVTGSLFMEYGFYLCKTTTDACQNTVIRNCNILLSRARVTSIGIHQSNRNSAGTNQVVTNINGCSSNNKYYGNTISAYNGIRCIGYSSSFADNATEIGLSVGNSFTGFGGLSSAQGFSVIYTQFNKNAIIANNTMNGGAGTQNGGAAVIVYGINNASTSDCNVDIFDNSITISCTEADINAIYNTSGGYLLGPATTTVNIHDNVVTNCNTGTIYRTLTALSNSPSADFINIYGNEITSNIAGYFTGIQNTNSHSSGGEIVKCYSNIISNNESTSTSSFSSSYLLRCTAVSSAINEVYNNTISNFTSNRNSVYSIWVTNGSSAGSETRVYKNTISDITAGTGGTGSYNYGIYISAGLTTNIQNNMIANLKAPMANSDNCITGINISSSPTNVNVYNNSIHFSASSINSPFGSSAIYTSTSPTVRLINNIISNNSTASGAGYTTAYRRSSTTLATYENTSDYNLFYAGVPSATNLIYYDGTNSDQTLAAFQTRVASRDANSISTDPTGFFTSTNNLHLGNCTGCAVENAGILLAAVSDDIDNESRNNPPEIGADEKSNPLPIELNYFRASQESKTIQLEWSTFTEVNNSNFTVYKINIFNEWIAINQTSGAGNSNTELTYECIDNSPNMGWNYYKLTQTDFDGTQNIVGYASINITNEGELLSLKTYPNPSFETVTIETETDEPFFFEIIDSQGQILKEGSMSRKICIDVSEFRDGVYVVRIFNSEQIFTKNLLILKKQK